MLKRMHQNFLGRRARNFFFLILLSLFWVAFLFQGLSRLQVAYTEAQKSSKKCEKAQKSAKKCKETF